MEKATTYIAFNGRQFNTEDDCIKYENELKEKADQKSFLKELEIPLSDQDEFTLFKLINKRISLMMDLKAYYIDKDTVSMFEKSISVNTENTRVKVEMYLYAETISRSFKRKSYDIGDLKDYMEEVAIDKTIVFICCSCIYTINYIILEEIYDIINLKDHLYSLMDSKGVSHADFK